MKIIKRDDGNLRDPVTLGDAMNRFFDESLWDPFSFLTGRSLVPAGHLSPSMNISEDAKAITVEASVPGFEAKDIEVDVHNHLLTISGKTEENKEENEKTWICRERSYGEFRRQVRLPDYAEGDKAVCKMKNGVLTITIPKSEEASKKTLRVEEE